MTPAPPTGLRFLGHPVHVMLIHFPVALWPAHFALHVFAHILPAAVSAIGGFWLLAAGTILGWLAAGCGALDLFAIWSSPDDGSRRPATIHACVNGSVLAGFTILAALEYNHYPAIQPTAAFLAVEAVLLLAMFVGNHFGGDVVWRDPPRGDSVPPGQTR
ncbi:MAG TPA: DUF2231 domain-containing protein [Opitutus sp.]|nr:DUF2231 domain-containing protein [Opitutus sp.]